MYTSDWSSDTANTFSNGEIYIPNYTVAQNRAISAFGVEENNATTAYTTASASLYRSTTAITSITLIYTGGNNHLAGSTFYLYGISNA
jgi:citrate lyase synthetase